MDFSWLKSFQKAGKGGMTGFFGSALMFLMTDANVATLGEKVAGLIPGHIGEMTVASAVVAAMVWAANVLKHKIGMKIPGVI